MRNNQQQQPITIHSDTDQETKGQEGEKSSDINSFPEGLSLGEKICYRIELENEMRQRGQLPF